ncbi:MAG: hypothetical protein JWR42_770 [Marmoricola sp.]|nr:hypothetical protein [Marmoricola sp.]
MVSVLPSSVTGMSQSPVRPVPGPSQPSPPVDVDQVLRSLDGLEDLPVGDHVAVFEQAHGALRRALDEAGAGQPART